MGLLFIWPRHRLHKTTLMERGFIMGDGERMRIKR